MNQTDQCQFGFPGKCYNTCIEAHDCFHKRKHQTDQFISGSYLITEFTVDGTQHFTVRNADRVRDKNVIRLSDPRIHFGKELLIDLFGE